MGVGTAVLVYILVAVIFFAVGLVAVVVSYLGRGGKFILFINSVFGVICGVFGFYVLIFGNNFISALRMEAGSQRYADEALQFMTKLTWISLVLVLIALLSLVAAWRLRARLKVSSAKDA